MTKSIFAMRIWAKFRSQGGQAMVEYVGITTLIAAGLLVGVVGAPWGPTLFKSLQGYIDLVFYALNVGIG